MNYKYYNKKGNSEYRKPRTRKEWRAARIVEKQNRQHEKGKRLLARMALELYLAIKKFQSRPVFSSSHFPRGGVLWMAIPNADREVDRRRVPESFPRIRGWRTTEIERGAILKEIRVRTLIGGRNGSVKTMEDRGKDSAKPIPRTERRLMTRAEIQEELENIAAQREENVAILDEMLGDYWR